MLEELVIQLVILLASFAVLIKTSGIVITYSTRISRAFGIKTFAVGFLLIATTTTLPELGVSIFAGLAGTGGQSDL